MHWQQYLLRSTSNLLGWYTECWWADATGGHWTRHPCPCRGRELWPFRVFKPLNLPYNSYNSYLNHTRLHFSPRFNSVKTLGPPLSLILLSYSTTAAKLSGGSKLIAPGFRSHQAVTIAPQPLPQT
jgi:hypothetical protein